MKKILFLFLLILSVEGLTAKKRVINNPVCDYYDCIKIDRVEINDKETICDITVSYIPKYWYMIGDNMFLQESGGKRKYKLLRSEGYELNTKVFMPDEGFIKAKLYFERIDDDVKRINTGGASRQSLEIFNLRLSEPAIRVPEQFKGVWMLADGTNKVHIIITDKKVIYANDVWNYKGIKSNKNSSEITIECKGEIKTVYLSKSKEKDNCIIVSKNKKEKGLLCSKDFTELSTPSNWTFDNNRFRDKLYSDKPTVIRGYIEGYVPELGLGKTQKLSYSQQELGNNLYKVFNINPDGTFEFTININTPQEVSSHLTSFFIVPGDTIAYYTSLREYKALNKYSKAMSNKESGELITYLHKLRMSEPFVGNESSFSEKGNANISIIDKIQDLLKNAENFNMQAPQILNKYSMSDFSKGVIYSIYNAKYFTTLIETIYGNKLNKANPNYIEIDYYDYLHFFNETVMDNPLIVAEDFGAISWYRVAVRVGLENEMRKMFNTSQIKMRLEAVKSMYNKYPDFINKLSDSSKVQIKKILKGEDEDIYSEIFNPIFSADSTGFEWSAFYINSFKIIFDKFNYADSVVTRFKANNSFKEYHNSFIEDYAIAQDLSDFIDDSNNELTDKSLQKIIAGALPLIGTNYVRESILNKYTSKILNTKHTNNNLSKSENEIIADSIFAKIIEPYKGNVLYIVFWNINCGPSIYKMIEQKPLVEKLKNNKIKFLYVCNKFESPLKEAENIIRENGIKGDQIRISIDEWNYLSEKYSINATPCYMIVDKAGNVVDNNSKCSGWGEYELTELEKK